MKNSRGSITVDYLFAFFLVSGLSMVIVTFSATLSIVEVTQYMAFAAARNFLSSNLTIEKQQQAAQKKFSALRNDPAISALLNGGWYEIPNDSFIVDANIPAKYPAFQEYEQQPGSANLFHGVIVGFRAKILNFQIPFLGQRKNKMGQLMTPHLFIPT